MIYQLLGLTAENVTAKQKDFVENLERHFAGQLTWEKAYDLRIDLEFLKLLETQIDLSITFLCKLAQKSGEDAEKTLKTSRLGGLFVTQFKLKHGEEIDQLFSQSSQTAEEKNAYINSISRFLLGNYNWQSAYIARTNNDFMTFMDGNWELSSLMLRNLADKGGAEAQQQLKSCRLIQLTNAYPLMKLFELTLDAMDDEHKDFIFKVVPFVYKITWDEVYSQKDNKEFLKILASNLCLSEQLLTTLANKSGPKAVAALNTSLFVKIIHLNSSSSSRRTVLNLNNNDVVCSTTAASSPSEHTESAKFN